MKLYHDIDGKMIVLEPHICQMYTYGTHTYNYHTSLVHYNVGSHGFDLVDFLL